jgi:hypothetical protein
VPKSRATGIRWLREHPGLGVTIGGRRYLWVEARKAIARGVPLDQAAEFIRRCVPLCKVCVGKGRIMSSAAEQNDTRRN